MSGLQDVAEVAVDWFESSSRPGSEDRFVRVKDGAPEWVTELVHAAHGDFLPDDWRYAQIWAALESIRDADDPEDAGAEFADSAVDVYTGSRLLWLGSNLRRVAYVDDAVAELGGFSDGEYGRGGGERLGVVEMIGLGQYAEALEIYELVVSALADVDAEVAS